MGHLGENAICHGCGYADAEGVDVAHENRACLAALDPVEGIFWVFTWLRLEDDVAVVDVLDLAFVLGWVPEEDCPGDIFGGLAVHGRRHGEEADVRI
jgi:hypothetical protein